MLKTVLTRTLEIEILPMAKMLMKLSLLPCPSLVSFHQQMLWDHTILTDQRYGTLIFSQRSIDAKIKDSQKRMLLLIPSSLLQPTLRMLKLPTINQSICSSDIWKSQTSMVPWMDSLEPSSHIRMLTLDALSPHQAIFLQVFSQ